MRTKAVAASIHAVSAAFNVLEVFAELPVGDRRQTAINAANKMEGRTFDFMDLIFLIKKEKSTVETADDLTIACYMNKSLVFVVIFIWPVK